jgi:hypothetical protein
MKLCEKPLLVGVEELGFVSLEVFALVTFVAGRYAIFRSNSEDHEVCLRIYGGIITETDFCLCQN